MTQLTCDLLVIGAGSGGLSVAAGASQMGAKVILLEGHKMGGDCLNYGCVPSKALIAAAKMAHATSISEQYGITYGQPEIDYSAAMDHVRSVIQSIEPHDSVERFEGLGVQVIQEFGKFIDARTVQAGEFEITARRIVIATGSSAFVPPIDGINDVPYLTNETLFENRELPQHLIILGGGPIGVEMAQAHARFGARVTVIQSPSILPRDDHEMTHRLRTVLQDEGITFHENEMAQSVQATKGGITVGLASGATVEGSHILIATGRVPNIDTLQLEKAGITYDRAGIPVSAGLRTSNRRVYAIGDVVKDGPKFTHAAGYHAGVVVRNALLGLPARARHEHIPYVTFTDPELAQVGLTEVEAKKIYGTSVEVARFDIGETDRARAERLPQGEIKMMVRKGRAVGVSILGPQAGEMINFWAFILTHNIKLSKISAYVSPYPTLHEANKRVVGAYFAPKLFNSSLIKWGVGMVQRLLP